MHFEPDQQPQFGTIGVMPPLGEGNVGIMAPVGQENAGFQPPIYEESGIQPA